MELLHLRNQQNTAHYQVCTGNEKHFNFSSKLIQKNISLSKSIPFIIFCLEKELQKHLPGVY